MVPEHKRVVQVAVVTERQNYGYDGRDPFPTGTPSLQGPLPTVRWELPWMEEVGDGDLGGSRGDRFVGVTYRTLTGPFDSESPLLRTRVSAINIVVL